MHIFTCGNHVSGPKIGCIPCPVESQRLRPRPDKAARKPRGRFQIFGTPFDRPPTPSVPNNQSYRPAQAFNRMGRGRGSVRQGMVLFLTCFARGSTCPSFPPQALN